MNPVRSLKNRLDARKRSALVGRADAARDAKKWREAAGLYRESLDLVPADADIWVQFGHMMKEDGALGEAEAAYRKAISLRPRFSDTHLMLGHALKLKGQLRDALQSYRVAVELDPNDHRAREEFAALDARLAASSDAAPPAAAPAAQAAPAVAQPTPDASNQDTPQLDTSHDDLRVAGDRARDARNLSEAAAAYKRYLAVRADDAPIWVQYGHVLKDSGYFDAADAAYAAAENISPDMADTYLHHGHMLKTMGRTDDAIRAFRRLAALDPTDTEGTREADALERSKTQSPAPAPAPAPAAAPAAPEQAASNAASFRASDYAEAEIRALKDRLAKSEEQLRLMQGQSRAIRVLSSELVKARQEIGDLTPRITSLEAENRDLRNAQAERLAALESKVHKLRELEPNHPFLLAEQHLARRAAEKKPG